MGIASPRFDGKKHNEGWGKWSPGRPPVTEMQGHYFFTRPAQANQSRRERNCLLDRRSSPAGSQMLRPTSALL
jgi:hypothetical protein